MKRLLLALGIMALPTLAHAQTPELFETSVRPVLAQNCYACHTDEKMGGLRLDSKEDMLKGGKSGPAIVPGDPDMSLLMTAIKHSGDLKMPLRGEKLSDKQISDLAAWIKSGADWPAVAQAANTTEFFESRIRPVFAQQCFSCHTNSKMGGLRLDSRELILKGGASGPAVVPGDVEKSRLISAIRHSGELKMPKGGSRLTDSQIADITAWVKDGAYWPDATAAKTAKFSEEQRKFWSFQPLQRPETPKVKDAAWPINDIDRFVLARLDKEGLKPAPVADRRTLLRRVSYDLTGLAPTFEEVKAFEADKAPNAYEKVIDRLLATPQYGERWARHWMDVVRYAEDDYRVGKQPDRAEKYQFAYLYRDWVIRAFNEDLSYDMFVKAQLAGDLLDEKIRDKMIPALGMNGNGIWIFHASPAPVERADEWHDKVDVTTKAFLGMTVGCARCHDHKFDPIPTKDYYRLAGVFASSNFKPYPQVPKSVVDAYDKEKKVLEAKEAGLKKFMEDASELYAQMLFAQTEDYMVASWKVGSDKKATVQSVAEEAKLDVELLEKWVRFLKKSPDNYAHLKPWQEFVKRTGKIEEAKTLAHDFYTKVSEINEKYQKLTKENEIALAQLKTSEEQFDPLPNDLKRKLNAYQIDLKSLDREDTLVWKDMFDQDVPELGANVDPDAKRKPGLLKLTEWPLEKRLTADLSAHVTRLKADIEAFKKEMPPQYPFVYGIAEAKEASDLKVFVRGNPYTFGDDAPRAFLSIFSEDEPKHFEKGSGRLELAEDIIAQPISARVIVNRVWRWHMGRGITDTPNNLGFAGDRPTNPELLEYLASKFIADGMSFKKLHKDILMSRTYQLSSATVESNMAKDADNAYFWRANRQRLESEGVWDALLQASGTLDTKAIGGPSEDIGEKMVRRAVYAKVSRMYPNDFQATFDLPTATISAEKRYTTNVPQQRLFFLNNPMVLKEAAALAERVRHEPTEEAQVTKAFQIVYQRVPTAEELTAAVALIKTPPYANAVRAEEEEESPTKFHDSPLRSMCWALISSNEFLFID